MSIAIETFPVMPSFADSRLLLDSTSRGEVSTEQVADVLRRYFSAHTDVFWGDALAEHELL